MRALSIALARCMVGTVIPAVFRRANVIIARLVRSPLNPLLLGSVIVVRCEGRRTGRTYLVPERVACTRPQATQASQGGGV